MHPSTAFYYETVLHVVTKAEDFRGLRYPVLRFSNLLAERLRGRDVKPGALFIDGWFLRM